MYKGEKREGTYYRTFIHGEGVEYIPVKLERKKTQKKKFSKLFQQLRILIVNPMGIATAINQLRTLTVNSP